MTADVLKALVCCETGIGKSTLLESLFNQKFDFSPSSHDLADPKLKAVTYGRNMFIPFRSFHRSQRS
ncbi:unnamed protein product [Schistosoma mattheei]|uniref:Uncharacterized protein n=1 Tax=Schistosoma mattheei TaxID=31246 RepID=A0A183PZ08_9TREM|nr:unnamed protein product [Schistosoma mattheei]